MDRSERNDREQVRNQVDGVVDAVVQARDVEGGLHITVRPERRSATVPRELPPDVYSFVGRSEQLRELDALLGKPDSTTTVISAVSGTPGVGKTALAIHWAHRVRDRFTDGDLYVDLQGFSPSQPVEATDVLARFLRGLGVPDEAVPATLSERATRFRSLVATRRMLVVLDNARTAEQVRPLLPGSGTCTVLVTSRDRLAGLVVADGARRISLDVLSSQESVELLDAIVGDRVTEERSAALELCEWAAQLPLALRIIGMRAHDRPHLPLAELARELSVEHHRLDLLDLAPEENWSVKVVFSWSYRALTDEAARCFRLTSRIPSRDFPLFAAAQLLGQPEADTQRLIDQLIRSNLLEASSDGRMRMHDLLRTYAATLAGDDEVEKALGRLFTHYLSEAETDEGGVWLAEEIPNLVACFEVAAERGWHGFADRLYNVIHAYLRTVPETRSAIERPRDLARVLAEFDDRETLFTVDPGRRDRDRLARAEALLYAGLSEEAIDSLSDVDSSGSGRGLGDVQLLRSAAALIESDLVSAARHASSAERVFKVGGDGARAALAGLLGLRAAVALDQGSPTLLRRVEQVAGRLMRAGLPNEADIARLLGHRVSLRRGTVTTAAESVLMPRHISSVDHLILLRLVRTELEIARGNLDAALEHACCGLVALRRHRSWISGIELVGGTVAYGIDLAVTVLKVLIDHPPTDLADLFDWIELVRTSSFRHELRTDDDALDTRVAEIRRLAENFELTRSVDASAPGEGSSRSTLRGAALRYATAGRNTATTPPRTSPQVYPALGERVLISFMGADDRLRAFVVRDGDSQLVDVCDLVQAMEVSRQLLADIDAHAPDGLPAPIREVVEASAHRRASWLDELLFGPLAEAASGRELVIVPAMLQSVAWSMLPSLVGRTVTTTPSAAVWLSGAAKPPRRGRPIAVIGPGLPGPFEDFSTFVDLHPQARVLRDDEASCGTVLRALDGASLAHLSARGTNEPSNALFSRLEMADGALFGHQLQILTEPPGNVVLGAHELTLDHMKRNDEPLGFAGALLAAGVTTVTVALTRVGLRAAAQMLSEYYTALASGIPPAAALAATTAGDPLRRPYICVGWGG